MGEEDRGRSSNTRDVAEALAIYAAVPAATMYPLGLLVLWLQISYSYGESLSSAWFAANLVPSTALAGMGITAVWDLLNQWISLALLTTTTVFIIAFPRRPDRRRSDRIRTLLEEVDAGKLDREQTLARLEEVKEDAERIGSEADRAVRIPLLDLYWTGPKWGLALLGGAVLFQVGGSIYLAAVRGQWAEGVSSILLVLATTGGAIVLARDGYKAEQTGSRSRRWFLRGFAITFVGILAASALESGLRDPILPKVFISDGGESIEATFLAHEGSYWYLVDESERLRAIPDDAAGEVRFAEPLNADQ